MTDDVVIYVYIYYINIPTIYRLCWLYEQEGQTSKALPYDDAACPNIIHTACNSTDFVRAAAVYPERKSVQFEMQPEFEGNKLECLCGSDWTC